MRPPPALPRRDAPAPCLATCQAIQECHDKKEADLKKTFDLHSFSRMLKALETQLPRVKEALELPDPRLDQVLKAEELKGGADDYDEHGNPAFDEVRPPHQTMHTPRAPCANAVHTRHAQVCSHQTNEEA